MGKKILAIGDYKEKGAKAANWHPFDGIDEQLEKILGADNDIKCTDEYPELTGRDLRQYDILVFYPDAWGKRATPKTAGAVLSYVARGGSILTFHSGLITPTNPEILLMHGAKFTGHPEACDLKYTPAADSKHPILNGIPEFTIFEEPYRFTMAELAAHEMLLTYSHEGQTYPAAWTLPYGMGKVVYLSIGHTAKSFESETFVKLILNCVDWLAQK